MNNNKQEKALIEINESSIFYKIKNFFRKLFKKQKVDNTVSETFSNNKIENDTQKQKFLETIKNIENEETKLLKLQKDW